MGARKRQRYIIGVDLGGTNIIAGAMPEDGSREISIRSEPTRADQGADAVVDRIARMIEMVIADTIAETGAKRDDFAGVGVGSPGPLDRERGIVIVTPNLGWRNFPLRDEVSNRVGLARSEEHTSELQSHSDLHSFPTRRSSDLARPTGSRAGHRDRYAEPRLAELSAAR